MYIRKGFSTIKLHIYWKCEAVCSKYIQSIYSSQIVANVLYALNVVGKSGAFAPLFCRFDGVVVVVVNTEQNHRIALTIQYSEKKRDTDFHAHLDKPCCMR